MVFIQCKRCKYIWNYKGGSNWYVVCPKCQTSVKVIEKYKLIAINQIDNEELLQTLYYYIGKQTTNFRITHSKITKEGIKIFSKWVHYLDATQQQIAEATHRTLLKNEIVLDFDKEVNETKEDVKKKCKHALIDLTNNNINFKAYDTTSNGYHVHIFMKELFFLSTKERKEHRLYMIKKYGCDAQKSSDNITIALEGTLHWKTGKKMFEVGVNDL